MAENHQLGVKSVQQSGPHQPMGCPAFTVCWTGKSFSNRSFFFNRIEFFYVNHEIN